VKDLQMKKYPAQQKISTNASCNPIPYRDILEPVLPGNQVYHYDDETCFDKNDDATAIKCKENKKGP
jgi:hypothetical protein